MYSFYGLLLDFQNFNNLLNNCLEVQPVQMQYPNLTGSGYLWM